jgi:hypothetical protein
LAHRSILKKWATHPELTSDFCFLHGAVLLIFAALRGLKTFDLGPT